MLRGQKSDSDIAFPMEDIKSFKKNMEKPMKTAFTKPSEEEETKDDDDKQYSVRFLILDYFEYTSGHGPPRILASKQLVRKIFWTLLFLAALGVSSWQIATLFETYKSRPLSTHVAIQHETSLDFPAITVCNFNAVKLSALEYFPEELRDDIKEQIPKNNSKVSRKRRAVNNPPGDQGFNFDQYEEEEEGIEDPDSLDEDFRNTEEMIMIMAEAPPEELMPFGHQFDDFVLSCTYRGVSCGNFSSVYWTSFWHYAYGNCYVFNSGKDKIAKQAPVLKSNKPGPSHGLNLELNIQQDEYLGAFTEEAGVRIDISNQGEMPFPREKGLSAAPGFSTSIGMRKVELHRKDPFSNNRCSNTSTLDSANLYRQGFQANYSSTACKESCLAFNQRKECKCMEYRFPIPSNATSVCNIFNKTTVDCLSRVQRDFKKNKLNCTLSCPPPCRENLFKLTSSFAAWPSTGYEPFYVERLEAKEKYLEFIDSDLNSSSSKIRSNVLKLNIFFEELNFESITEKRSYELANFVSDLGGSLGLWIGMSVLSFAEVFELLLLIGYALLRKLRTRLSGRIRSSSIPGKGT